MQYIATLEGGETVEVEAKSLGEAMDIALWEHGEDHFVIAVEEAGTEHEGGWMLMYADGFKGLTYPTKDAAIANNDTGDEILIAVPNKG